MSVRSLSLDVPARAVCTYEIGRILLAVAGVRIHSIHISNYSGVFLTCAGEYRYIYPGTLTEGHSPRTSLFLTS